MYLLVLIILGLISLAIIWQLHEYQKRADARAEEDGEQDSDSESVP
jgi:type II secretory pathway pseudopilin PulG